MTGIAALRTHCPACGSDLTQHERFAGGFCSDWQCRRRRIDAQRREELQHEIEEQRAAAASSARFPAGLEAPVVLLHWYDTPLEPVPSTQRDQLRAHLMALQPAVEALAEQDCAAVEGDGDDAEARPVVAATIESAIDAAQPEAEIASLQSQICARCTGYCCRPGNGQHAFIDAELLHRLQLEQPQATHAELVQIYLDHIPTLHRADSCAFHGEHGCALPRARRSEVCNSFLCVSLQTATRQARQHAVRRFYVVRHDSGHGPEGVFIPSFDAD